MVKHMCESENGGLKVKVNSSLIFKSTVIPCIAVLFVRCVYIFFLQSNIMLFFVWMPVKGHGMSQSSTGAD